MKILTLFLFSLPTLTLLGCIYHGEKSPPTLYDQQEQISKPFFLPKNAKHNFSNLHKYILKPKCISCHSGDNPDDDIDLTTYEKILNNPFHYLVIPGLPEESSLLQSVLDGNMPTEASPLSAHEVRFIQKWIELSAPAK